MGQRLNIEIWNNGEAIANSYYHWSAYTLPAINLTKVAIKSILNSEETPLNTAIVALQATGSGFSEQELDEIKDKEIDVELFEASNRNDGILSITESGIEETRCWMEGLVEIYLDSHTISFGTFFDVDEKEYLEDGEDLDKLPIVDIDFDCIPFDRVEELKSIILDNSDGIRLSDGRILMWIV